MVDLMLQNHEAMLLEGGLPPEARLAHKHGYVADTHADAAIVFTPEVDFVLVVFIYYEEGLARPAQPAHLCRHCHGDYNYYHMDEPYVPVEEGMGSRELGIGNWVGRDSELAGRSVRLDGRA